MRKWARAAEGVEVSGGVAQNRRQERASYDPNRVEVSYMASKSHHRDSHVERASECLSQHHDTSADKSSVTQQHEQRRTTCTSDQNAGVQKRQSHRRMLETPQPIERHWIGTSGPALLAACWRKQELMPRNSSSRVRLDTKYKRAHAHAHAPPPVHAPAAPPPRRSIFSGDAYAAAEVKVAQCAACGAFS